MRIQSVPAFKPVERRQANALLRFEGLKKAKHEKLQEDERKEGEEEQDPDIINRWFKSGQQLHKCITLGSYLAFGLLTAIGLARMPAVQDKALIVVKQDKMPNPWPENTKVYASSTQEYKTFGEAFTGRVFYPFTMQKPLFQSLDEAVNAHRKGWTFFHEPQVPIVSTSKSVGWHRKDNGKVPRYVMIITGPGRTDLPLGTRIDETRFAETAKLVKDAMMNGFNIPEENILELKNAESTEFQDALSNWLSKMPDKHKAEVLIFYNGHGIGWPDTDVESRGLFGQGSYEGDLSIGTESEIKVLFNRYLKDFKHVAFFINSCHAGSFVA